MFTNVSRSARSPRKATVTHGRPTTAFSLSASEPQGRTGPSKGGAMTRTARTTRRAHHFIIAPVTAAFVGSLLVSRVAPAASSVEKLQEFTLDQVQVTDTYYQNLFTKDLNYL